MRGNQDRHPPGEAPERSAVIRVVAFFQLQEMRWVLSESDRDRLETRFPQVRVLALEGPGELPAALAAADVFVGWQLPREHFGCAPRLRWVHSASAGVEAPSRMDW